MFGKRKILKRIETEKQQLETNKKGGFNDATIY